MLSPYCACCSMCFFSQGAERLRLFKYSESDNLYLHVHCMNPKNNNLSCYCSLHGLLFFLSLRIKFVSLFHSCIENFTVGARWQCELTPWFLDSLDTSSLLLPLCSMRKIFLSNDQFLGLYMNWVHIWFYNCIEVMTEDPSTCQLTIKVFSTLSISVM